jgi:hypothetical protein
LDAEHAEEIALQIISLEVGINVHWFLGTCNTKPGVALEMVNCILEKNIGINIDRVD